MKGKIQGPMGSERELEEMGSSGHKSILVIAMTRMGDLFQMAPMIVSLRERYPMSRIGLVAYQEFGETAVGLALFDDLFLVDGMAIRKMVYDDSVPWTRKIQKIKDLTAGWSREGFDLLINLTPNRIGTVLGYLVRAREVRGVVMTRDGFRAFFDPGIAFFGMMVRNRIFTESNLVDLFLRIGRVPPPMGLALRSKMGKVSALKDLPDGVSWIAVQTGASVSIKRWPESSFVRMIAHLLSRDREIGIVLIGAGEEDVSRNRRIVAALEDRWTAGRILNLTGQTSVNDLSAILRSVSRLVSNDTGAMHVAAAMGTSVVALSFANLFYPETAPYGENHVVLQTLKACAPCGIDATCLNPVCREDVEPEWLARFILALEDGRERGRSVREAIRDFLSNDSPGPQLMVALSGWDGKGKLRYRPMSCHSLTVPALFRSLYRQIWAFEEGGVLDWGEECDVLKEDYDVSGLDRSVWEELRFRHLELGGFLCEGESLCNRIGELVEEGVSEDTDAWGLAEKTRELESLDLKIQEIGWVTPSAAPITTLFEIEKEGVVIDDPMRLLEMVRGVGEVYRRNFLRNERLIRLADLWFVTDRQTDHERTSGKGSVKSLKAMNA